MKVDAFSYENFLIVYFLCHQLYLLINLFE